MEQHDKTEEMLTQYFATQRNARTIQRALFIRALQKAAKEHPIDSSTLWRLVSDSVNKIRIDIKEFSLIAGIELDEARYLVEEVRPEPLAIRPPSMANILLTFGLTTSILKTLLRNAFIAKYATKKTQRAVARSSEAIGEGDRARAMQDGLNALFIQINGPAEKKENHENALSNEDNMKLDSYITSVAGELQKLDADYLIS
ncbi:MAG TPA: hypothetical protein VMW69_14005 [Spirochaetia bacterium]|nr:hypothetical protein [Spirochaetia bacterium]